MIVYFVIFLLLRITKCENSNLLKQTRHENGLDECVTDLITKYHKKPTITYVSKGTDDRNYIILNAIHSRRNVQILSKKPNEESTKSSINDGYLIVTDNADRLSKDILYLFTESTWSPKSKFFIIINTLSKCNLTSIFDNLMKQKIINVLVINATDSLDLYAYNPYENYGCGKRYERIIDHGRCSDAHDKDLFPNKLVNGLKNCTMVIHSADWTPYSVDLSKGKKVPGIDQYVIQLISEKEQFNVKYNFSGSVKPFATLMKNNTATDALSYLQQNKADIVMGGLLLTAIRASVFSFLADHTVFSDESRYIVKRADFAPMWKTIYVEFEPSLWMLLAATYVTYSMMVMLLYERRYSGSLMLKMWDSFFLHGAGELKGNFTFKYVFLCWIWFAYLVNTYYETTLFSITTRPKRGYQIKTEAEIRNNDNMKQCFSDNVRLYFKLETADTDFVSDIDDEHCHRILQTLETVSKASDRYTVLPYFVYLYHQYDYYDPWGEPLLYLIKKPISKLMHALYLQKGFPMMNKFRIHALRIRESGIIEKNLEDQNLNLRLRYHFKTKPFKCELIIPWEILIVGSLTSTLIFLFELCCKKLVVV